MIQSIKLNNFFSFSDQTIELTNTNIMVGINGSGKSNVIKAIRLLKAAVEGTLNDLIINKWGGFDAVKFCGTQDNAKKEINIGLSYVLDPVVLSRYGYHFAEPILYSIWINGVSGVVNYSVSEYVKTVKGYEYLRFQNGKGFFMEGEAKKQQKVEYTHFDVQESAFSQVTDKDRYTRLFAVREAIKDIAIYDYFDTTAQSPIRKPAPATTNTKLKNDGSNLILVLNQISINDRPSYALIQTALRRINPHFEAIAYNVLGSNIDLLLGEEHLNRAIHVTHISDGTLRYLCLLAILFNQKRGSLVCIDEPEVGLHPDMLYFVAEYLQKTQNTQFVVASHSETLLNQFEVDDILVLEKNECNQSEVQVFRSDEFRAWASDYSTGQLWRNGNLGGKRF